MAEISMPKKWQDLKESNGASGNQRSKARIETKPMKTEQKVPVLYYLSRNGQLEHPHFMVVPLSSQGLYLKDVMSKLISLRGQGIASMYSWSSKRSYKNGFVWQDLSENDLIYPCQGHEYVLKGSQVLESSLSFRSFESTTSSFSSSSSSSIFSRETNSPGGEHSDVDPSTIIRRKHQSWGSFDDLREYQVHKPKTTKELAGRATNASTQTDEKTRPRKSRLSEVSKADQGSGGVESLKGSTEVEGSGKDQTVDNACECGKTKASTVLMQLITCGSTKFKDCGSIKSKD
ncbi:hypothetical protein PanWU01x14_042710 [Parasponia andersonii]|uniref:SOSEKI DIX-like domain-containing protein n=1 Tax=Parasponia andersonii TaxID=3476 RepID=A0A2P5DPS6_PARAD|nr:hypothetical protein PanWU01x14_042710 [Parasponia andersonii]